MSEIRANSITDAAGTGAPDFPNGLSGSGASLTDLPAPTSAQVGTATAGLAYGAVGTYGLFRTITMTQRLPGSTIAGSDLYPANTYENGTNSGYYVWYGSVSGTWRLMGETGYYNGGTALSRADMSVSVFMRIS